MRLSEITNLKELLKELSDAGINGVKGKRPDLELLIPLGYVNVMHGDLFDPMPTYSISKAGYNKLARLSR